MRARPYLLLAAGLIVVAGVAVTLAVVLRSAPQTGDQAADDACYQLSSTIVDQVSEGQAATARVMMGASEEARAELLEAAELASGSTLPGIRAAGAGLAAAVDGGYGGGLLDGLFGGLNVVTAVSAFGSACTEAGWDMQAAGIQPPR